MKSLQNISYKTLFTILFLALAGIVFFLKIGGKTQKVSATWWDDSWHYRQAINISSHNTSESNVYITTSINIGTTAKAQVDDGDFRFISQSGEDFSYYIVSGAGTTNVSFHILIPSFPSGTSTIYAYYGNSTVANGFSAADFSTQASNYTIGSLSSEEAGGGPIAYWKFDEGVGTTAYDSTSNQNNGIFGLGTSIPTWQTENQCINGKCLYFDGGKNYVDFGNNSTLKVEQGNFTVETWFKSTISKCGAEIVDKGKNILCGSAIYGGWSLGQSSGKTIFRISDSVTDNNASVIENVTRVNEWVHAVGVRDGDTIILYINGKRVGSTTQSNINIDTDTTIRVGGHTTAAWNAQAFIDDVKIYPYARTAAQIKQDYNSRGSLSGSSANLGVQSNTSPSLKSSLVAYYKFDESNGSTVKDYSGHNFTGTFGTGDSSPTWTANGKFNKALSFDGNDSITLSNEIVSTSLIRTNGITYSAWIKPNNISGTQKIFGQKPSSGYSDLASGGIDISSGKARMIAYDDNIAYKYATGNTTLNPNQWYLITGVYNPSDQKIKIYVNGKFDGGETSIVTFNRLVANNNNIVGSYNYSNYFFNGLIDEIKIYNTALTDDQIKQDYNQGSAISFGSTTQTIGATTTSLDYCIPGDTTYCASPVAEWKMDEGVGTSIIDTSGNNNTGIFGAGNSAPTFTQGKIGKGLSFDGINDFVDSGTNPNLNFGTNSFSVFTWVKFNVSAANQYFINGKTVGNSRWHLYVNSSNYLSLWIADSGNTVANTTINTYNPNQWYYLGFVRDKSAGKVYLYQNGILMSSANDNTSNITSQGVFLGAMNGNSYWFNGQLDNTKIYNYARTPAQIAYDYNHGGPIGWWKMDECQGSTIYDWSGNSNNGTLTIGSSGTQDSIGTCQIGTSAAWTNGATGKFNSSLNFDGTDDYISLNKAIIPSDDFSISNWFYPTDGTDYKSIIGQYSAGQSGRLWYGLLNSSFGYRIGAQSQTVGIDLNKWTFGAITRKNGEVKIYINGQLKNTSTASDTIYQTNTIIGKYDTSNGFFTGQIDDVRIYNYALTSEQIKQVYNGGAVSFN